MLVLDSPTNRNALSRVLVGELRDHLAAVAADASVRAVALTGTGNTFCSGADLKDPPAQQGAGSFPDVLRALWDYPKPVVVAVNGHVRAGGFGLVAAGDVVLGVASSTFAFTEVRIGVVPAIISVLCLRRMTPVGASRYLLTGEQFAADEAVRVGLLSSVVADGSLESELDRMLAELRRGEPEALRVTRSLMRRVLQMDFESGLEHAREVSETMFASAPAAEGIAAFREKRLPGWAV